MGNVVSYELLQITEEKAIYKYFPEGEKEHYGVVVLERKNNVGHIERMDEVYPNSAYGFAVIRQLERYNKKNFFRDSGWIALY